MTALVPGPGTPAPLPPRPGRRALRWPEASTPSGAILYAMIGGLLVWFLVDILPHVHIVISWR
jgi:hypothetical protein